MRLEQRQTNKPRNLTVTLRKSNFLGRTKLGASSCEAQINSASTFELRRDLYLIDEEVRCAAAVFKIWRLFYCGGETDARCGTECSHAAIDPPENLPLMSVPLSRWSMCRVIDSHRQLTHNRLAHTLTPAIEVMSKKGWVLFFGPGCILFSSDYWPVLLRNLI